MPVIGLQFGPEQLSWAQALERSELGEFPYPPPLIRAMMPTRDSQVPTASVLAGCMRRFELQRTVEYHVKPANQLAPLFGTAFHALMAQHREGYPGHSELSLTASMDGHWLAGTVDFLLPGSLISDWKTKRHIPKGFSPPPEHRAQVNVYNWLAAENGYEPAREYELVYVDQGWLSRFIGPLKDLSITRDWISKRLRLWSEPVNRGELPAPLTTLFNPDPKQQGPCRYCEVREQCVAALKETMPAPFTAGE